MLLLGLGVWSFTDMRDFTLPHVPGSVHASGDYDHADGRRCDQEIDHLRAGRLTYGCWRADEMKRTIIIGMGILGLALIAACGSSAASSGSTSSPSQAAAASSSPAAPALTCADISTDLSKVVNDLKAQDKKYQEAWVSGGDSGDLQTLINDTQNAASGGNQLNTDAAMFNSDASTYLSDNSPYLAPGWQSGYSTVTDNINALATDCGQKTAPANTPQDG